MTESTKSPAEVLGADEWSELERLAEAATPGPWLPDYPFVSSDRKKPRAGRIAEVSISHKSSATFEANLLFIAAANPATVLRLISALRQASIRGGEA